MNPRAGLAALLLAATGALWLAVERGWVAGIDRALLLAMAGGPAGLWHGVSVAGDSLVRIAIALPVAGWLLWRRHRVAAALLAVAVLGGMGLNALAKDIFDRPRPDLLPHLDAVGVLSFPSGHAAGAMILGLMLARIAGGGWWLLAGLAYAALVGVSRMALAVHWPSDVAAGWCLGAAWMLGLTALADARWPAATDRRSRSPR